MRLRFTVFGREVCAVHLDKSTTVEVDINEITGGSGHDFERALEPEVYYEEPEERGFGFG